MSKAYRAVPRLAVVFLLLSSPFYAVALSPRTFAASPNIPAQFSETIPSNEYYYAEIDAYSLSGSVAYNVTSNTPITVALMDSSQFNYFNNTGTGLEYSIICQNGTSSYETENIPNGPYYLVLFAYGAGANASIGYFVYPNTPYSYYGPASPPEPTGIASFGITNSSGTATPYEIQATSVVGLANISSMLANNPDAESYDSNVAGATLQLNTYLVVNGLGGGQQVYWIQNTPDFSTSSNLVSIGEDLWNYTTLNSYFTNQTVTSTNPESGVFSGDTDFYLAENNASYAFPFNFALIENASVVSGTGVVVKMGIDIFANGTAISSPKVDWFDTVTFHDPGALKAYFDVNGNLTPLAGGAYDSELVFAGEGDGEPTTFTQLDSTLGLFYQSEAGAVLDSFPSYYSFGVSTAESAYNLAVTYANGFASVSPGTPDYVYLGTASSTYTLPGTSPTSTTTSTTTTSVGTTSSSTTSSTATSTTSTSSLTTTSTTTSATSTTASTTTSALTATISSTSSVASTTSGIPEFPYQAAMLSVLVAAVAIAYLFVRHRTGQRTVSRDLSLPP